MMKCWWISNGEWWMFGHGETRSQAIQYFLGAYTDNTFDEFIRGDIMIRTMRIPEFDGQTDVDCDYLAVVKRCKVIWCPECDYESMVAGPKERWEDMFDVPEGYRLAYLVDGDVMCSVCAEKRADLSTPIQAEWGYSTSFERYRELRGTSDA
jgi:hypothetical protein